MTKTKNPLSEIGEEVLRTEFVKKVVIESDKDCWIKTLRSGNLHAKNPEDLFWIWVDYCKSL
jgi:uncharacterized protein (DUF927 family)